MLVIVQSMITFISQMNGIALYVFHARYVIEEVSLENACLYGAIGNPFLIYRAE